MKKLVANESEDGGIAEAIRLHEQALALSGQGKHHQAAASARRAIAILEAVDSPNHPDVANVLNCLAASQIELGRYGEALRSARRSVAIMEAVWAEGDAEVVRLAVQSLNQLATIHRVQGRYDEAEPLFRR